MRPDESFVGQPIRSLQTMLRVISEDTGDLPSVIPDGIYSQDTMNAVSAFQRRYGLPITGVTDHATWEAIVAAYEPALVRLDAAQPIEVVLEHGEVFRMGDKSPYLYLVQSMLLVLAQEYPNIAKPSHSGTVDTPTAEALAAFQLLAGLPPTGELDRVTWKYLTQHYTLLANQLSRKE